MNENPPRKIVIEGNENPYSHGATLTWYAIPNISWKVRLFRLKVTKGHREHWFYGIRIFGLRIMAGFN